MDDLIAAFHEASKQKKARVLQPVWVAAAEWSRVTIAPPALTRCRCPPLQVSGGKVYYPSRQVRAPPQRRRRRPNPKELRRFCCAQRWTLPAADGAKPVALESGKKLSDYGLKARHALSASLASAWR